MIPKSKVVEDLNFITDKLSTQVRTIALGILVFVWGLLVGQSATTLDIAKHWKWTLMGLGGAAIFVMLIDFLQYVAAYWNVSSLEQTMGQTGEYDTSSISYKLRLNLFGLKIVLLIMTVIWLLGFLVYWLSNS